MTRVNAYYERGYNTRIGAGDVPAFFERYQTESEAARNDLPCHLGLRYGDANRETVDIFPAQDKSGKWIVFIHGGYWRMTDTSWWSFLAVPFVQGGYNVAFVEYDLCPAVTMGTIIEQVRRGIAWVANHAGDVDLTCDEMVITGHSAGGHLTGMMFATNWADYGMSSELIAGGIAISGLFDLDPISQTAMNVDLKLNPDNIQKWSPSRLTPMVQAPMVVTLGSKESSEFLRQSMLIKTAPDWENVASDVLLATDYHHFDILYLFMDLNSMMWKALR